LTIFPFTQIHIPFRIGVLCKMSKLVKDTKKQPWGVLQVAQGMTIFQTFCLLSFLFFGGLYSSENYSYVNFEDPLPPSAYIIESRGDRYGSNVLTWVSALLLSHLNQTPLYHLCTKRCLKSPSLRKSIYHKILTDYCQKEAPPEDSKRLAISKLSVFCF